MLTCILALVLGCNSKVAPILNVVHAGVSFADTYQTQRTRDLCRVFAGCNPDRIERNPLTRPFQNLGKPAAYIFTAYGVIGTSMLAQRMRTTTSPKWRWTRKVWWVPQIIGIGASSYGIQSNVSVYNSRMAQCGAGCAVALRIR